ncbi:hypothetical protein BKA70DRAFT_1324302 [Coprinopsis sp. MPI-PUGE-AT-0042]|nr:hypothetical protein BKA70DRAFT_1324302 [Coprinopsis sp. MPI-PUGE-AT-0042]
MQKTSARNEQGSPLYSGSEPNRSLLWQERSTPPGVSNSSSGDEEWRDAGDALHDGSTDDEAETDDYFSCNDEDDSEDCSGEDGIHSPASTKEKWLDLFPGEASELSLWQAAAYETGIPRKILYSDSRCVAAAYDLERLKQRIDTEVADRLAALRCHQSLESQPPLHGVRDHPQHRDVSVSSFLCMDSDEEFCEQETQEPLDSEFGVGSASEGRVARMSSI